MDKRYALPLTAALGGASACVLRRLQKEDILETYDKEFQGRNRRYYQVTEKGRAQLNLYISEWHRYSARLNSIFEGGLKHE